MLNNVFSCVDTRFMFYSTYRKEVYVSTGPEIQHFSNTFSTEKPELTFQLFNDSRTLYAAFFMLCCIFFFCYFQFRYKLTVIMFYMIVQLKLIHQHTH